MYWLSLVIYLMEQQNHKILGYDFNGRVDSIWYDGDRNDKIVTDPTIFIHGKTYDLSYHTWDFRRNIQPGDSMIKLKNRLRIILIKKNGSKIVYDGD